MKHAYSIKKCFPSDHKLEYSLGYIYNCEDNHSFKYFVFQGKDLIPGWLILPGNASTAGSRRVSAECTQAAEEDEEEITWTEFEFKEYIMDLSIVAETMITNIRDRYLNLLHKINSWYFRRNIFLFPAYF